MAKASVNVCFEETPNAETRAALEEIRDMKAHPENYKSYSSFQELLDEVSDLF